MTFGALSIEIHSTLFEDIMAKGKKILQKAAGTASTAWISRLAKKVKALLAKEKKENERIATRAAQTVSGLRKAREAARAKSRAARGK